MGLKVAFLDVDGVLNCTGTVDKCGAYIGISDEKVGFLKEIVDATQAVLVLSSTWRLGYNKDNHPLTKHSEYLNEKLAKQGLSIYDVTKQLDTRPREILDWLEDKDAESFVILDDEDFLWDKFHLDDYWVRTEFYDDMGGLNESKVAEAIKILNRKE